MPIKTSGDDDDSTLDTFISITLYDNKGNELCYFKDEGTNEKEFDYGDKLLLENGYLNGKSCGGKNKVYDCCNKLLCGGENLEEKTEEKLWCIQ